MLYGPKQASECNPGHFPGILAEVAGGVLHATLEDGVRDFPGVFAYFTEAPDAIRNELVECCQGFGPQPADCGPLLAALRRFGHEREKDILANRLKDILERGGDTSVILEALAQHEATAEGGPKSDVFRDMLVERIFDVDNQPARPVPILKLGDKTISTEGNITAIQAGIKAGKTGALGAILAAIMSGPRPGWDTLGFSSDNIIGEAVLHFDTEQSRFDHDGTIRRALSRVGLDSPPPWFQSFSLTDLSQANREIAIETAIEDAVTSFGGIFAILLDGVADLCRDPNNSEEAFALVDKIHSAAARYHCAIVCVIHENPGSEKTRGHLGSQLARKAETNIRLAKDPQTGVTTVWADFCRHTHIPKNKGLCFEWSEQMGMHVSKGSAGEIIAAGKQDKFRKEAEAAFGDFDSMSYSELIAAITKSAKVAAKTAEKRVTTYQSEGVAMKNQDGTYSLKS